MNYTLVTLLVCGTVLFFYAAAQSFEDPKRYFKPLQFDPKVRGTFNVTPCLRELLNCWETVRPDMFCSRITQMTTLCEVRMQFCNDKRGYGNHAWKPEDKQFNAFDLACIEVETPYFGRDYNIRFGAPEYYVLEGRRRRR